MATSVLRAFERIGQRQGDEGVRVLLSLLASVPALHTRWLSDLQAIERQLVRSSRSERATASPTGGPTSAHPRS